MLKEALLAPRRYVESKLGDRLVLWINPTTIDCDVGTKWPVSRHMERRTIGRLPQSVTRGLLRPVLHQFEPFVVPSRYYGDPKTIESIEKYRKVEEFIRNGNNIECTLWFRELVDELEHCGVAKHKSLHMYSVDDISAFLKTYVADLVESMRRTGYCLAKGPDLGAVIVNRRGKLDKAGSGNHRFYVAKVLGLQRFPVRVTGVHSDWWHEQKESCPKFGIRNLPAALSDVERRHQ